MGSVIVEMVKPPIPFSMIPHAVDRSVAVVPFIANIVLIDETNKIFFNLKGPAKCFAWKALSCFWSFFKWNQHGKPCMVRLSMLNFCVDLFIFIP